MDFNWSILGWIAAIIFVYIFGLYEGRGQGYKKRKAEEQLESKDKPSSPSAKPEVVTMDDPGILRIKDENGSFALDLDGTRVNPISLAPDQRKRLIEMLNIMRPWLEGHSVSTPTPAVRTSSPPPQPASLNERLDAFGTSSAEVQPPSLQQVSGPPQSIAQPPARGASTLAKEDRPAAPANSIVSQIDSVLQARLEGTPLQERGIFLTQSPEGGVMVYVGLTRYSGIDEVPDPEIKAAIRAAITEWEDRYTPGLKP
jgi:hypothetical protein